MTKLILERFAFISFLTPVIPYGVLESWEDLNPRLYHAIHIYWLKFYGQWFNSYSPNNILFWLQFLYALVVLLLVCFLPGIGEVVYLVRRRDNVGDVAEGLYLFLSEMYTYFKIAVFWYNKNKVLALLDYLHCEEFKAKEQEHKDILRKSIKTARFIMTAYSTMCVGAVSVGIIMPITENFEVLPTNVEYPYFDVYKSPIYEIMYIHHIYYKPATCIIDGVMDTILASFIASAIGQIEILSFNLENVRVVADRRRARASIETGSLYPREYFIRDVLRDCIIHHNSIIRYVSMIESTFSLSSALQFMLSAMVLCLVGIQFLSIIIIVSLMKAPRSPTAIAKIVALYLVIEDPATHPMQIMWMAIYLTCMLTEVFIICWFGNELIWKSNGLQQSAFDGDWVNMDEGSKKYIKLFLERCKQPLRVTAGKIFILSLDTYTNLINWSYKAFAVIRNMKH